MIHKKLEAFIRKYYTNELIRGILLFIGLGLIYFIITLSVEHFLWLKPNWRSILFWFFVIVETFLLVRFILFPLSRIFKLKKGINFAQASIIIGNHFSEVQDTLTNYLQLSNTDVSTIKSELLLASIEQKATALRPIPFGNAIDFNVNKKYIPLAIFPVIFLLFFFISGNSKIVSQSFNRVVHFNSAFSPPAPFNLKIINPTLVAEEGKDFILRVKSEGKLVPENVSIVIGDESYFLESVGLGEFQYKIVKPVNNLLFHLEANSIVSSDYELKVIAVPSILNFEMQFIYPKYLKMNNTVVKGTGNGIIPEGTVVNWRIYTKSTQKVLLIKDLVYFPFIKSDNYFSITKSIYQNTDYQVFTSNNNINNYEKLNYHLTVVKDQYPTINFTKAPDSLGVDSSYFVGQLADDYGLTRLAITYYESGNPSSAKRGTLSIKQDTFDQVVFSFPGNLDVDKGKSYDFYFEVFDNDAIHNFKSTRSTVFSSRILSDIEKQNIVFQEQNSIIDGLQKSLSKQDKQFSDIDKLQQLAKEKVSFDFNEQQKIKNFLKQQQVQNDLMKEFAQKMKNNLENSNSDFKQESKEVLEKRLENSEKELEKNKKLLDELNNLNNKIRDENFDEKLDQFQNNSKVQNRNLSQLLELSKRYYVESKAKQISDKLNKLSLKEEKLSESDNKNSIDSQKEINNQFEQLKKELNQLDKDNEDLKVPMDIPSNPELEKDITDDLNKATSELQKNNNSKAKENQKNAAKKMNALSNNMKKALAEMDKNQIEEDVKILRQILDNLLAYSFSQEEVMNQFKGTKPGAPSLGKYIRVQQNLKLQFKHIDDSLFSLSLRQAKIAEAVTKEVANVQYNIDKSLESFSESQLPKGVAQQQYAITSSNKLADLLSDSLFSMQTQISGSSGGKPKPGQGSGMQLSDIIKKQGELSDKMKQEMNSSGSKSGKKPGGQNQNGSSTGKTGSSSDADGEGEAQKTMEIYQDQKILREALQEELNKKGMGSTGKNTFEQMKQLEKLLLNSGYSNESLQRSMMIKQELLKLETAIRLQGQDSNRQSETNNESFKNTANPLPKSLSDYLNSIEILNRQSLPLRPNFNQKVQTYFNNK